jgi:hypothetical protein
MRGFCWLLCVALVAPLMSEGRPRAHAAPAQSDYVGLWVGTWEGAGGNGGFELTLEKGKDGALTGGVSVTGEPTYKATLRTVTFDGKKMNAAYDFPPDDSLEILLTATFEGTTAKGSWSARQKGGSEVAAGTWTVTKK